MNCFQSFDSLCRKIVSPTRHPIDEEEMINRKFKGRPPAYTKFFIQNRRDQKLSAIYFYPMIQNHNNIQQHSFNSVIVYLHGNGGNKLQILQLVKHNLNQTQNYGFAFCSFDFSGCGQSQGQFVTYGQQQVEDIDCLVKGIRQRFKAKRIYIWGRSMGASLGLLYCAKYTQQIQAMILDSPFKNLKKVLFNVASNNQKKVPSFLIHIGIYFVQRKVEDISSKNIFQIDYSNTFSALNQKNIPLLFAYSTKDTVVTAEDVIELYSTYKGKKKLAQFNCTHPEDRPKEFILEGLNYLIKISQQNLLENLKYKQHQSLFMQKSIKKQTPLMIDEPIKPKKKPGLGISTKYQQ